jgi:hypothetical protein
VAQADRGGDRPVLFYRLDRAEWRAVWPLAVVLVEQRANYWRGFEWMADTTISAWPAVAREVHETGLQAPGLANPDCAALSVGADTGGAVERV